jgi:hypothetical protein
MIDDHVDGTLVRAELTWFRRGWKGISPYGRLGLAAGHLSWAGGSHDYVGPIVSLGVAYVSR